jgi:hypothetical protein
LPYAFADRCFRKHGSLRTREGKKWQTKKVIKAIRKEEAANNPASNKLTVKRVASRQVGVRAEARPVAVAGRPVAARAVDSAEVEAKAIADASRMTMTEEEVGPSPAHLCCPSENGKQSLLYVNLT